MEAQNLDLNAFLALLDYGLRREGDQTFAVSPEGIRAFRMEECDWELLSREEQVPLLEFEREARLDFPCTLEEMRGWVERNWHEMPESLAKALEEAQEAPARLAKPEGSRTTGGAEAAGDGSGGPPSPAPALVEAEPSTATGTEGQASAPTKTRQGQALAAVMVNPRELELVVEVRPERIIVTNLSTQTIKPYGRGELLGKAEKGWALLCLFAQHYNALPAKLAGQLHELNSASNRRHLGDALKRKLALKESPVIRQNPSSLAFASLRAEYEGIDAMDRQLVALDARDRRPAAYDDENDPAAAWLREHDNPTDD